MRGWTRGAATAMGVLMAAGCGERQATVPGGPQFHEVPAGAVCSFSDVQHMARHYFSPPQQQLAIDSIRAMEAAGAHSLGARSTGFNVLRMVASAVESGAGGAPLTGSNFVNQLLLCMYDPAVDGASLPASFPADFTTELDPLQRGAFAVRGVANDGSDPVAARPGLPATFSIIRPPDSHTWVGILSANPAPNQILVYGRPGSTSQTFDWKVVPRSTQFAPSVVVAVCVDAQANATSLLHESGVGLLPFLDEGLLLPGVCSPTAVAETSWPLFRFAGRMLRGGARLALPRPLVASALSPGGLSGSTGDIKRSEFGPQVVNNVTLTFRVDPTDTRLNQIITPAVQIEARSATTGALVANVAITVDAINNNGTPGQLNGTKTRVTNHLGIATFADLSLTKTGGYRLLASGGVGDRPAIAVNSTTSKKFNVRP